ncbi:MAG: GNAT family N-acetyltransferase [Bacteroidota bacterium]
MINFSFRKAIHQDIPFLVETIIEAEKSGTEKLTYTTIFGLSEDRTKGVLKQILEEETDGCELSLSSFFIIENDETREIAGAIAIWLEGIHGVPSSLLKGNLLNYILPRECLIRAAKLSSILKDAHIDNPDGALQLGLVYVTEKYRGKQLVGKLINNVIELYKTIKSVDNMYVQVFGNNIRAINAYKRIGFVEEKRIIANSKKVEEYLPSRIKVLMKKRLSN